MMDYAGRAAQADTFPKLLRLNAKEHGGEIALREKDLGLWRVFTWNDYQTRVHDFALGMVELGLGRGDVIGIIGDNRPDWVAAEIATHAVGAMSLGLYRDVLDEEARICSATARRNWCSLKTRSRSTSCWRWPTARPTSSTSSIPIRAACGNMTTLASWTPASWLRWDATDAEKWRTTRQ
jgi:acyl-CoA synthetase (AMP-forming)/AMP-acid ligase II